MMMRKILFAVLAIGLVLPLSAHAEEERGVAQDVLRFAPEVVIDVPVTRDVIAVGGTVVAHESVAGDVIALGGIVVIRGDVAGDVRVAAGTVRIESSIGGNVAVAGGTIEFAEESSVAGSVAAFGDTVSLAGSIAGDVSGSARVVASSGAVGGTMMLTERPARATDSAPLGRLFSIISLFGMLVTGLVLVSVAPKSLRAMVAETTGGPWRDFLWGVGLLVGTPLTALVLALTIIGLPIALILIAGYAIALYVSQVVLGVVLGTYVIGALRGRRKVASSSLTLIMVVGVTVFWLVTSIPGLGPLLAVVGIVWGLGLLIRTIAQVARRVGL